VASRPTEGEFLEFARAVEPPLRAALVARFGPQHGREAAAETLSWAWEHWERLDGVENRAGYVYRVGARRAARRRWFRGMPAEAPQAEWPWVEPGLPRALAALTTAQRQAIVLVEGYGLSYTETARLLGVSRGTVQTHVQRALARLRSDLGVRSDV
jgi:DNA-directed RNA polymerase specialized sigma24 family protein